MPMHSSLVLPTTGSRGASTASSKPEEFVARYTVIKNSWRGNYTRIFCIGTSGIVTVHPQAFFQITNSFPYLSGFAGIQPEAGSAVQFTIYFRNNRGSASSRMCFTCASQEERADLLTDVERFRKYFDPNHGRQLLSYTFDVKKYRANHAWYRVFLRITSFGMEELDAETQSVVGEYLFSQIKGLTSLEERADSFVIVYGPLSKLYLFEMDNVKRLTNLIMLYATKYIGVPRFSPMDPLQKAQFDASRLGVSRSMLEPVVEFSVTKITKRHGGRSVHRLLSSTHAFLVERTPDTYDCTSVSPLKNILSLVRCPDDGQKFCVEHKQPYKVTVYRCPHRDSLLAHILEACRACGNSNISVVRKCVDRGMRFCGVSNVVSEEIERTLLSCLVESQKVGGGCIPLNTTIQFFNANINYNGLCWTENKDTLFGQSRENLIQQAIKLLLCNFPATCDPVLLEHRFYALRRLTLCKVGFASIASGSILMKEVCEASRQALRLQEDSLTHAVIEFLNTLITSHFPEGEIEQEIVNKRRIAASESFVEDLLRMLRRNICNESSSLVVLSLLNFFEYVLCTPYSESTDSAIFNTVMKKMVQGVGKGLFRLLAHPCDAIRYGSGQLIRASMEESEDEEFKFMQQASLVEGGFLHQFSTALFGEDRRLRDLARRLLAYWAFENPPMQELLRRILPPALLKFLQSSENAPAEEMVVLRQSVSAQLVRKSPPHFQSDPHQRSFHPQQLLCVSSDPTALSGRTRVNKTEEHAKAGGVILGPSRLWPCRVRPSTGLNWSLFFYQVLQNHLRTDLIWNQTTRNELKNAIEVELETFCAGQNSRSDQAVAWNHQEFEVRYPSLAEEVKVGQHYPRLLFDSQTPIITRPKEFFDDMYFHFLLAEETPHKLEALRGMSRLYSLPANTIGELRSFSHFVRIFLSTTEPLLRDRLLLFFLEALKVRANIRLFLDAHGVEALVEHVATAHLHTDRPQWRVITDAIEASDSLNALQSGEKQWYYLQNGVELGPVSFTQLKGLYTAREAGDETKVRAENMTSWRQLSDVPQLRWGIASAGKSFILNYSQVTCTILDIFQYICDQYPSTAPNGAVYHPLPRAKLYLSQPTVLPHLVQLLLTFDSAICNRVHTLLYTLMKDNPLMTRLFLTGYYYFALIYTASDVLPLSRMLYMSHNQQSVVCESDGDMGRGACTSVLTPLLPPAMVCFLSHHGPEKFAEVFLGEYETPEIIWGKSMRLQLAGKVAAHLADFLPRLLDNHTLLYRYCPIVNIAYEQLQQELFCSRYYLRHLCDTVRYPNWPIREVVVFLRDLLSAWHDELNKPPRGLSYEECLLRLDLVPPDEPGQEVSPQRVRKAYFEMATRYHPDKNPGGQEEFQKIHQVYTFLMSQASASCDKPDPRAIQLILQSQCILYHRYATELKEFRYAGYGLLSKLLRSELADQEMLQKHVPLLLFATELCRLTVQSIPLNVNELQKEDGIELLGRVASRCFELITPRTAADGLQLRIASHCMFTFATLAQFEDSASKIRAIAEIPYLVTKGLAYANTFELLCASTRACEALCLVPDLQVRLTRCGVMWHLLKVLLDYDATLPCAGVALEESHHTQLSCNRAAVLAMRALCALAGFVPDSTYLPTKPNDAVRRLLERLLTPYLVHTLATKPNSETEVLGQLNSNSEAPNFYWDHSCRTELVALLDANTSLLVQNDAQEDESASLLCRAEEFSYTLHRDELQVGDIFLRLHIAQSEYKLDNPGAFFLALVEHLKGHPAETAAPREILVLTSLKLLVNRYFFEVELLAAQYAPTLVAVLSTCFESEIAILALNVLERLMDSPCFTESLCKDRFVVPQIAILLGSLAEVEIQKSCLQILTRLLEHRAMIEDAFDCGLHLILLLLYATGLIKESKEMACVCLCKAFSDKLVGPRIHLNCAEYLPQIFLDVIKEGNLTQACAMLDAREQSPELIWDEKQRERFVQKVSECRDSILSALRQDPLQGWKAPLEVDIAEPESPRPQEVQVGGVFLSVYVQNPKWQVRRPKEFLVALLDQFVETCQSTEGVDTLSPSVMQLLQLLSQSGVYLLNSSESLKDYSSGLGYMHKLLSFLSSPHEAVALSALRWLNEMWSSALCIEATLPLDPLGPLLNFHKLYPTAQPLLLDTLERLISFATPRIDIPTLAARHRLVPKLLQNLEEDVTPVQLSEPLAATRARVIKIIKAMIHFRTPDHCASLHKLLQKCPVWQKYKDQSHELFLFPAQSRGQAYPTHDPPLAEASSRPRATSPETLSAAFPEHEPMGVTSETSPVH